MLRLVRMSLSAAAFGLAYWTLSASLSTAQQPIVYHDPIAEINRKIDAGEAKLEYREDDGWGYLGSVLELLDINSDSQALVFSKTSLQQLKISPEHPRAIYFNDNVTVGAVDQGEVFEFTSLDPRNGLIYYTLDQARQENPRFQRDFPICAACHAPMNRFAQGIMVASSYTASDGRPFFLGSNLFDTTDHRTPFEQRWGGWYVTGTHGEMTHRGNSVAPSLYRPYDLVTEGNMNITSLEGRFNVDHYLEPTSDLIALMTLEHQTTMTNFITSISAQARLVGNIAIEERRRPTQDYYDQTLEDMITYMLFADEFVLEDPVRGVSTFTETFPQRGPRDSKGRSLRDFDLETRLFKYPLSYMIYTESFDAIPPRALDYIYRRLYEVLSGEDQSERFARLSAEDRQAILEILRETKPNLPDYYIAAE